MDQTPRVNRGLRYLCLDQYKDSTPELVIANISKLRLLQSFDLDLVHLPPRPGFPHDGAVRIPQDASEPERLIWFDFLVLLEDEPGTATRYGTTTMAQAGNTSPPAFYIVIFPNSPDYVAIVPQTIACREGESDSHDIPSTGITGPYFPYLMPEHLIPLALNRISLIPWGSVYTNPGTGVVLKRWFPIMTESPRDSPTAPLFVGGWSSALLPSNSAGKKRRREFDLENDSARLAPALREMSSAGISDLGFDIDWTENDLFGFDWPLSDQAALTGDGQVDYTGCDLPETWTPGFKGTGEGAYWGVDLETLFPSTQAGSATVIDAQQSRQAASLRAIAPAPLAVEATHLSPASAPSSSPSDAQQSSKSAVVSPEAEATGSESEDDEEDAPPRRLIELHPQHPWCNHIYLPPSTQDILTQLLARDTVCLPVITNPSDNIDGSPMPLSVLSIAHPCLHVLSSHLSPETFYLLPSRWVDFFHCSLNQLLNSTSGESKRSALRGTNKIITENPTVVDAFKRYAIDGVVGSAALSWGLWDEWVREFKRKTPCGMTREEDRNACCEVREVLQAQVDWSMRMLPDFDL
ncbi:hypothetical protein E4T52_06217 [Aureobasidium sp. EXF-3400]|nr:hypothetical protein E4T51_01363 [Aureobasidium sp. EXF-12344]KAI4778819.1 hypothetical protein E4T52_06217 [Aureobasidium sp. EXF-3400]